VNEKPRREDADRARFDAAAPARLRGVLTSAKAAVGPMAEALRMRFPGILASGSGLRRFVTGRRFSRKFGSIDEPLGSAGGVPPWIIAWLVLIGVAAVLVLAIVVLVPPQPPPYT
jgi:hypothetical protein